MRLVGGAGKSRKEAGEGSGLLNGGRREKTRLECIECGPGERSEIELEMEVGSPTKGLVSQQDKCSNPWDYEHLKGSLGKTIPVRMWSVGLRDTTEAECLVRRSPEQLRQEMRWPGHSTVMWMWVQGRWLCWELQVRRGHEDLGLDVNGMWTIFLKPRFFASLLSEGTE